MSRGMNSQMAVGAGITDKFANNFAEKFNKIN